MRSTTTLNPQVCGRTPSKLFCREALIAFLRQQFTESIGYNVEAVTAIPAATVENWLQRRSSPTLEHAMRLIVVFGPRLLRQVCTADLDWLADAERAQALYDIDREMAALRARREKLEAHHGKGPVRAKVA